MTPNRSLSPYPLEIAGENLYLFAQAKHPWTLTIYWQSAQYTTNTDRLRTSGEPYKMTDTEAINKLIYFF